MSATTGMAMGMGNRHHGPPSGAVAVVDLIEMLESNAAIRSLMQAKTLSSRQAGRGSPAARSDRDKLHCGPTVPSLCFRRAADTPQDPGW